MRNDIASIVLTWAMSGGKRRANRKQAPGRSLAPGAPILYHLLHVDYVKWFTWAMLAGKRPAIRKQAPGRSLATGLRRYTI